MFRTGFLSIIRSLVLHVVYTAIGICHTGYVDWFLAASGWILIYIIYTYGDLW